MAIRATRRVAHDNQSLGEKTEADDPLLTILAALIFNFKRGPGKHMQSVLKIQAALDQDPLALGGIVGDSHKVNVVTKTVSGKVFFDELLAVLCNHSPK